MFFCKRHGHSIGYIFSLQANLTFAPEYRAMNEYYYNFTSEACATTLYYATEAFPDLSQQLNINTSALEDIVSTRRAKDATAAFLRAFNLTTEQVDATASSLGDITGDFAITGGRLPTNSIGDVLGGAGAGDAAAGALLLLAFDSVIAGAGDLNRENSHLVCPAVRPLFDARTVRAGRALMMRHATSRPQASPARRCSSGL